MHGKTQAALTATFVSLENLTPQLGVTASRKVSRSRRPPSWNAARSRAHFRPTTYGQIPLPLNGHDTHRKTIQEKLDTSSLIDVLTIIDA